MIIMAKNESKKYLIQKYDGKCFLNGIINDKNFITFHHIIPVRDGGLATVENGALLGRLEHDMFNLIERMSKKKGVELNQAFRDYKLTKNDIIRIQARMFVDWYLMTQGYRVVEAEKLLILKRK